MKFKFPKRFRVIIHGKNLLYCGEGGKVSRAGFVATRFVDANDERAAIAATLDNIRNDPKIQCSVNPPDSPPIFEIDTVERVNYLNRRWRTASGFTFYVTENDLDTPTNEVSGEGE